MALTESQAAIWKQIAQEYEQWKQRDPVRNSLMPVKELHARLPAVAPELIGNTLAQAASDRLAAVGSTGEDPEFKLLD
jgi:hypothetical protein